MEVGGGGHGWVVEYVASWKEEGTGTNACQRLKQIKVFF